MFENVRFVFNLFRKNGKDILVLFERRKKDTRKISESFLVKEKNQWI